jgi:hypothetical protein
MFQAIQFQGDKALSLLSVVIQRFKEKQISVASIFCVHDHHEVLILRPPFKATATQGVGKKGPVLQGSSLNFPLPFPLLCHGPP